MKNDPYAAFKDDEVPSDKLDMLTVLADAWKESVDEVVRISEMLAVAQRNLREIEENQIPEIMDDIELEQFKAKNGLTIAIKENVRCSIPKAQQQAAFAWLKENGHGCMIKRRFSIDFAAGEETKAKTFFDRNLEIDPELEIDDIETVANPTLVNFVKEKIEMGEGLPSDLFPVFRQRVAKIK